MIDALVDKLCARHSLEEKEYARLIEQRTGETAALLARCADAVRQEIYGNAVFVRGLIEISNICKNDCLYCGIRRSNANCQRYRLTPEEILDCADEGYALGFRTFVLQGGEDAWFTDERLCALIGELKTRHPDCAVTLSLGERSRESYAALRAAGADRYLLRHETADRAHYEKLHPTEMSYDNRMRCLRDLRALGFHGSKASYELRKICIDHVYQKYGAEIAVSISGDDIKTITRYYADPAQPNIGTVRIVDLL